MFLDSQDHLAQVQHQRHKGIGQDQGLSQGFFWNSCKNKSCSVNYHFKLFPDSQDHLGQDYQQRHQGVGQGQGLSQVLIFWNSCIIIEPAEPIKPFEQFYYR